MITKEKEEGWNWNMFFIYLYEESIELNKKYPLMPKFLCKYYDERFKEHFFDHEQLLRQEEIYSCACNQEIINTAREKAFDDERIERQKQYILNLTNEPNKH